jgi:3-oxoacid CoA-transferase B subunit
MADAPIKARLSREAIARRVAAELRDGDYVNLGVGIPILVAGFVEPSRRVIFHAENGVLGFGGAAPPDAIDPDLFNAGFQPVTLLPGGAVFDGATSFGIIRGRHLDAAVLGGLQVSERGDLANWMRPERGVGSVGGAADIAQGAKRVFVAMEHTTRDGELRIVRECSYPLTAVRAVHAIFTDVAVIRVTAGGLVLEEAALGWTVEDVQAITEPRLAVSPALRVMPA